MASQSPSCKLKLAIIGPPTAGTGHSRIRISYGGADFLDVVLQRKFRVPEDSKTYQNTARNGSLPIYSVEQFSSSLPENLSEVGGLMAPIFNREAMSLHFRSSRPYAVKMFVGTNNSLSGEPLIETSTTAIRRKHRLITNQKIRDYTIAGEPKIDTYRTLTGQEKQFVAGTPVLTIQVMPTKRVGMCIVIKKIDGSDSTFSIEGLEGSTKVLEVKEKILKASNVKVKEQMLILSGRLLDDSKSLYEYEIRDGNTLHLLHHTPHRAYDSDRSSDSDNPSLASSIDRESTFSQKLRKIHTQDWDKENTITFSLQLINATLFESLLGIKPNTPLVMSMFKDVKIPYLREVFNETKIPATELSEQEEGEKVEAAALAKANKKLPEIEILKLNDGGVMPEFLLEEEMIANLRDVVDVESMGRSRSDTRGSLSTWPAEVFHERVSPDRGEEPIGPFDFEM